MLSAQEQRSDVARLLAEISETYEAAQRGLTGLASGTARHGFITEKMDRMGQLHTALQEIVGENAMAMVAETLNGCSEGTHQPTQQMERGTHRHGSRQ